MTIPVPLELLQRLINLYTHMTPAGPCPDLNVFQDLDRVIAAAAAAAIHAYALADEGPYHPFRDHSTNYGWGICHHTTGRVFALIGDKTSAFACACLLNGHPEAALKFMSGVPGPIPDDYFLRFPSINTQPPTPPKQ